MNVFSLAALSTALAFGVWTHAGPVASAEPDPLERPALASARASGSMLLAVARAGDRLVAAGERGVILFSDDNGDSWTQARVPVSTTLTDVHFATADKGWAVGHGGIVLHSVDGGKSWNRQLDGEQAAAMMLTVAEKAVSGPQDARLENARRMAEEGADKPFFAVHFLDERRGFIVGAYGLFFATGDGGQHWTPIEARLDNPDGKHLYGITAIGDALYIAGEQGMLFHSGDAGQTFTALDTPYDGTYFGVTPLPGNSVLVHGLRGNAFHSHSASHDWRRIKTGARSALTAGLVLADGSLVIVSQAGEVLHSTDRGQSFRPLPAGSRFPFSDIVQAANADLVITGARGITRVHLRRVPE